MPTYRIGRRTDNDIVIDEPSISRRHAELFDVGDGTYRLRDLESRMGTLVRGPSGWNPIDLVEVDSKTPIRLGNYKTTVAELLVMQSRAPVAVSRRVSCVNQSLMTVPFLGSVDGTRIWSRGVT